METNNNTSGHSPARHNSIVFHDSLTTSHLETIFASDTSATKYDNTTLNPKVDESISSKYAEYFSLPVVSFMVATRNEELVIEGLLKSLSVLKYDRSKFEVVVVDDSTDSTVQILKEWTKRIENLKIIKRPERIGWKGGALNLALEYLRKDSAWVIILDADMILPPEIIEEFINCPYKSKKICNAIQGYCVPYNNFFLSNLGFVNWVSKGVEFRLAQRNMIEFFAKDKLDLPVQITGCLFMIKTFILKEIGFSADLCEDWELTLQLYLRDCNKKSITELEIDSHVAKTSILFNENLNAASQMPTAFSSYFRQRLRVTEGHTRGFIKMVPRIIKQEMPFKNKVELFLTGLQYLKQLFVFFVILLDLQTIVLLDSYQLNIYWATSFSLQLFYLFSIIITNVLAISICNKSMRYDLTFLLSKILLDICTFPALTTGSLLGFLRTKGTFYRTRRMASNVEYPM